MQTLPQSSEYEVLQVSPHDPSVVQLGTIERANVDSQIATAKQYPRDLRRAINNSIAMATMDIPTAQSCGYALPRGGKPITGPSVHLAKLIVANYGNIRTEAKVVQITDKQVISRGTCWDLENNVAAAFEVRRSIIGWSGARFSDDMITVTGNAANSIAYRNAVFSVIPKAITDKVYQAAQRSSPATSPTRRRLSHDAKSASTSSRTSSLSPSRRSSCSAAGRPSTKSRLPKLPSSLALRSPSPTATQPSKSL